MVSVDDAPSIPRELVIADFDIDKRLYTKDETREFTATILDAANEPVGGFVLEEAVINSSNGKLSILSQNVRTDADGNNVVRLLMYFDGSGSGWSDIYAGTEVNLSLYGADGKSALPEGVAIVPGSSVNADGLLNSEFIGDPNGMKWNVSVVGTIYATDAQVWLDFVFDEEHSPCEIIFSVDHIKYSGDPDWGDYITIRDVTVSMSQFPKNATGQYEFVTGSTFGSLGKFPLYLTLVPGGKSIFVKMKSTEATDYIGTMTDTSGSYSYSHTFSDDRGLDYETSMYIAQYGYFDNKYEHTDSIMLYFSGEPRYLGGLVDAPVLLGTTWEKDLSEYLFVDLNYDNVEYRSSEPNSITFEGSIARFSPTAAEDTLHDVVFTARMISDPTVVVSSDPITLYGAECLNSYDYCDDGSGRPRICKEDNYTCEYFDMQSSYHGSPQGVDLSILNKDVSASNLFPEPGEEVTICADVFNKGTTNVFDVVTYFYLDSVNGELIDVNELSVVPATYVVPNDNQFDGTLPYRSEKACIKWTVPEDLRGGHRIWVEVTGRYPLEMQEDMLSNNFATLDFYVGDPNGAVEIIEMGSCPLDTQEFVTITVDGADGTSANKSFEDSSGVSTVRTLYCRTVDMYIPITVRVCENEVMCSPVMGYEFSWWHTIFWPSWSGFCQEFGVPQEAVTAFIRTYERLAGLGSDGAMSSLPGWTDLPGFFDPPEGWSDGWLPCHPKPTMFWPSAIYPGVFSPGCGGYCPVSGWDCGDGVSFQPKFDSPYYVSGFKLVGGAFVVTRCHNEGDFIRVPVRVCDPLDIVSPGPMNIPFNPFAGGPSDEGNGDGPGGYGPNGPAPPDKIPGGGPPFTFTMGDPPAGTDGNSLPMDCYFCSTGTKTTHSPTDTIHCVPISGGPETGVPMRRGWNLLAPALNPVEEGTDRVIPLRLGWNLFGYSHNEPFTWSGALIERQAQTVTIDQAHTAGWVQSTIYFIDKGEQVYKFLPGDDVALRNNNSYWIYAAEDDLNLILPVVGGSAAASCFAWLDATVTDGIEILTITQAQTAGWVDSTAYYLDENDQTYKAVTTAGEDVCAWKGYWVWSNRDDLRLITTSGDTPLKMMTLADDPQEPPTPTLEKSAYTGSVTSTMIGQSAPDIALKDINGVTVRLSELAGKDVLLVFGTTQCPYCAAKVKLLNEISTNPELGGFEVIFVALGANRETAQRYAQQNGIEFTILPDPQRIAGRRYRVISVPTAYVIDYDGVIHSSTVQDGQILWDLLAGMLGS